MKDLSDAGQAGGLALVDGLDGAQAELAAQVLAAPALLEEAVQQPAAVRIELVERALEQRVPLLVLEAVGHRGARIGKRLVVRIQGRVAVAGLLAQQVAAPVAGDGDRQADQVAVELDIGLEVSHACEQGLLDHVIDRAAVGAEEARDLAQERAAQQGVQALAGAGCAVAAGGGRRVEIGGVGGVVGSVHGVVAARRGAGGADACNTDVEVVMIEFRRHAVHGLAIALAVLVAAALTGVILAPERVFRTAEPTPPLLRGERSDHLSPTIRRLVGRQDSLAAATPVPASSAEIRRYYRLRQDLLIADRHAAAADTLWSIWRRTPDHALWVDAAILRARALGSPARLDSMFTAVEAGAADRAVASLINTSMRWGQDREARRAFVAACDARAPRPMVSDLWLESRAAVVMSLDGALEAAIARLGRTLPLAWTAGGPSLAACWWFEISKFCRKAGRLQDAAVAAIVAGECARRSGDAIQEMRAGLALARTYHARAEFARAASVAEEVERAAAAGEHPRWLRDAWVLQGAIAEDSADLPSAAAHYRQSLALARDIGNTRAMVGFALGLAHQHRQLGDVDSARVWIDRAGRWTAELGAGDLEVRVAVTRLHLAMQQGEFGRADSLRAALPADLSIPAQRQVLFDLIRQGLDTGRPDLAYRGIGELRSRPDLMVRDGNFDPTLSLALLAARLHARQGEFPAAREQAQAAIAHAGAIGDAYSRCQSLEAGGLVAELAGDPAGAVAFYEQWHDLARTLGDPDQIDRSRIRLAEALIPLGALERARSVLQAMQGQGAYWTRFAGEFMLGCVETRAGRPAVALAHHARAGALLGDDAPATLVARLGLERARAHLALGEPVPAWRILSGLRLDDPAADSALEAQVYQAFRHPWRREVAELAIGILADHPEVAAGDHGVVASLARALDATWRVPGSTPDLSPAALDRLARQAPGPVVAYFCGESRVFAWVGSAAGWRRLEIPRERLLELIAAVQTDMGTPGNTVDAVAAGQLADLLLTPVIAAWPQGGPLFLVAAAPLDDLPWPALPVPAGDGRLVADHGPVIHLAGLDPAPAGSGSSGPRGRLLAVGVDEGASGPRLRHPEAEARAVARSWPGDGATVRTGAQAAWSELVRRDLAQHRVIHLASHARVSEGRPGESTLRLGTAGDAEPVTIPDVIGLQLDADLVFLSSCEGSRVVLENGTGLGSFARAFLQAGAGAVVASARAVDDEVAIHLAQRFYAGWSAGGSLTSSLEAARQAVRERWPHPFSWAYFQLHARHLPGS